jgi:hypothetical protein
MYGPFLYPHYLCNEEREREKKRGKERGRERETFPNIDGGLVYFAFIVFICLSHNLLEN